MKTNNFEIISAVIGDEREILNFINELASYENLSSEVVATVELLHEWLFVEKKASVIFAVENGVKVGFALYFYNFSTFLGRAGIYLEDLFVKPNYRGKGYGKALIKYLAQTAVENGLGRLEWSCLNWNKPSVDFYLSLGAKPLNEWTTFRLTGESLKNLTK